MEATNQSRELTNVELEAINLLGPVRDPLGTVVPMTILYAVVLLTGTVGNVCTCIVIARNKYMHTATNFYLFSLAISDLLLLILGLPQELFMLWQKYPYVFGEFFCVVRGLSSETSTNASILTITAFTIERYAAICHPLKSHTMSQLPRAIKTILVIWAVSAICALPVAWQFGIIFLLQTQRLQNVSKQCGIKMVYFEYGFETAAIVFFLVPITLISVLYILIGINLRRSSDQIKSESHSIPKEIFTQYHEQHHNESANLYQRHNSVSSSNQKQIASRRSVIRMLVAVVIAFFFCYSPFHAQRVLAATMHRYNIKSKSIQYLYFTVTHISGVTYYLSATINPILYQVMSQKFRIAFKDTFGYCLPCLRKDLPEITYSNIIGGVSSYKLSRTGSFYSNGSFHRQSINFDISSPISIRKASSVNEFALNDMTMANDKLHNNNGDSQPNMLSPGSALTDTVIISSPEGLPDSNLNLIPRPCKNQFLNVPSFKF